MQKAKELLNFSSKVDFCSGLRRNSKSGLENRRQRTEVRCQKTEDFDF